MLDGTEAEDDILCSIERQLAAFCKDRIIG